MKRLRLVVFVSLLLLPIIADAQQHGVFFTEAAIDATTAQNYTYRMYIDNSTTGTVLTGIICTATTPVGIFNCMTPNIPAAVTNSTRSFTLTASDGIVESPKSPSFQYAPPNTPASGAIR